VIDALHHMKLTNEVVMHGTHKGNKHLLVDEHELVFEPQGRNSSEEEYIPYGGGSDPYAAQATSGKISL